MNIGEAARASGVSAKMIRYYESIGLIPRTLRSDNGYRVYTATDVQFLRFIKRVRTLGFPMDEIQKLVALWLDHNRSSREVKAIALRHIAGLREKITELESMLSTLEHLAHHCHGDHRPDCPIIEDLASVKQPSSKPRGASKPLDAKSRGSNGGVDARQHHMVRSPASDRTA